MEVQLDSPLQICWDAGAAIVECADDPTVVGMAVMSVGSGEKRAVFTEEHHPTIPKGTVVNLAIVYWTGGPAYRSLGASVLQKHAIESICGSQGSAQVTGRAGVGKSEVISGICGRLRRNRRAFVCCAPTGTLSARMCPSNLPCGLLGIESDTEPRHKAYTLARLTNNLQKILKRPSTPTRPPVVIVDEFSMADAGLLDMLGTYLERTYEGTPRFIIFGDRHQIPSPNGIPAYSSVPLMAMLVSGADVYNLTHAYRFAVRQSEYNRGPTADELRMDRERGGGDMRDLSKALDANDLGVIRVHLQALSRRLPLSVEKQFNGPYGRFMAYTNKQLEIPNKRAHARATRSNGGVSTTFIDGDGVPCKFANGELVRARKNQYCEGELMCANGTMGYLKDLPRGTLQVAEGTSVTLVEKGTGDVITVLAEKCPEGKGFGMKYAITGCTAMTFHNAMGHTLDPEEYVTVDISKVPSNQVGKALINVGLTRSSLYSHMRVQGYNENPDKVVKTFQSCLCGHTSASKEECSKDKRVLAEHWNTYSMGCVRAIVLDGLPHASKRRRIDSR